VTMIIDSRYRIHLLKFPNPPIENAPDHTRWFTRN
jgi:hypothetical protein